MTGTTGTEPVEVDRAFIVTLEAMRASQKEYFKTRDREELSKSKRLERQVDQYLDSIKIPGLF